MIRRFAAQAVHTALLDTRAVVLLGPRQSGKSTLARQIAGERSGAVVTLDDSTVLDAARRDPASFLHLSVQPPARSTAETGDNGRNSHRVADLLVIDEVQKAPELFPAIKIAVDRDPRPGRFLLTGSADVLALPTIAESLAGRMEIVNLFPLSQSEIEGAEGGFAKLLFETSAAFHERAAGRPCDRTDVCRRIVVGGYPEVVRRTEAVRREAWFRSYVTAILERDIRDLADIEGLTALPSILSLLSARTASLMNASEISRSMQIPLSTLRRYLALLEMTFLFAPLPAWAPNIGKRFVKSPKVHLVDSGLAAHLRGVQDPEALASSEAIGPLLESFVLQELRTQLAATVPSARAHHFRAPTGGADREVDIVLEAPGGRVVGVEVKATASVRERDFRGLEALAAVAGDRFVRGVVLHLGEQIIPFGDRLTALPVNMLWS